MNLSFIQSLTEDLAWETAPRNCSEEVGEDPVYIWIFSLGNACSQAYILVKDYC